MLNIGMGSVVFLDISSCVGLSVLVVVWLVVICDYIVGILKNNVLCVL